ncbi:squamosa promoter-binding-like protein 3 [Rutidosis leptorrhynchoides]|uniref:squamosa promoter-binding-like protein 3 n=1 Tax=Rutidosis leptorrhynchoides TaxID=125765 RepID=UPI003A99BF24
MENKSSKAFSSEKLSMSKKALPNDRYSNDKDGCGGSSVADVKKMKGGQNGVGSTSVRCCQAEKCTSDLGEAKQYHRRHRVCEFHAKAGSVFVAGIQQRFCQQCSRFHELLEFDEAKRSCRKRLAGHNERRRKNSMEYKGAAKELQNDNNMGSFQMTIQDKANYKHLQTS